MRKNLFYIVAIFLAQAVSSQELQAKFSIVSSKVSSGVDKKIFQTLQTAVSNFLNNRKWTNDNYQPQEKIKCSFLFTIDEYAGNNIFKGCIHRLIIGAIKEQGRFNDIGSGTIPGI